MLEAETIELKENLKASEKLLQRSIDAFYSFKGFCESKMKKEKILK